MDDARSEDVLVQFSEIERRIEKLFEKIESLETANAKLKDRVAELEQDVKEKMEAGKRYEEERALMRSKIDALLDRINRFTVMENGSQAD